MKEKTIVFIAPEFFNFHRQIQTALELAGNKVHFIPDRPSKNALIKIFIRKARFFLKGYLDSHFRAKAAEIQADSADEIFIIRGEGLSETALLELKSRFPRARVQLYLWDSVARSRGCMELIPHADQAWTYDSRDAKKYPELKFTLNFYVLSDSLLGKKAPVRDFDWELVFFGTAHGDRLKVLSRIGYALPKDIRFYVFLYFQSPIMYYARKFFDPAFRYFRKDQLSLKPKFGPEWEGVVTGASAILDIVHPQQGGLTIRTLESLALGFKVITTDPSIKDYPFYNPLQILVIDRHAPFIPPDFLRLPNDFEIHPSLRELELSNWLKRFFT